MSDELDNPSECMRAVAKQLTATNVLLAEWTACALENSPALVENLEQMGYAVRGKSREAAAEALKHPPARSAAHVKDA